MIYHPSIDADDPRHVAEVIAEMWNGAVRPFPPVMAGQSWMAMAGDERNSAVEVYPRGTEFHEAAGDADAIGRIGSNGARSATHFAMATALTQPAVMAIAAREGWPAKYRKRGDAFGVIEMWIEGTRMIEVLTPDMQREYLGTMTVEGWSGMLERGPAPEAA